MSEEDRGDNQPLVEGVDYYIENGRWVFTREYHLRRGSCCGSGCRHCPYREGTNERKIEPRQPR